VTAYEDHRHCKVCGRVCAPGEEACSKPCREKRAQMAQTRRMYTYLMYGAIALLAIVLLARFL